MSTELPPRPDLASRGGTGVQESRSLYLRTPAGPTHAAAALAEACGIFDQVMAGTWKWPSTDDLPGGEESQLRSPEALNALGQRVRGCPSIL